MAQAKKFTWGATGVAVVAVIAALVMWIAPSRQTSSAQDGGRPAGPADLARLYRRSGRDGGRCRRSRRRHRLLELRIKDGQKVKRDEIIAVLSNYPKADVALRMAEADLAKLKQTSTRC